MDPNTATPLQTDGECMSTELTYSNTTANIRMNMSDAWKERRSVQILW